MIDLAAMGKTNMRAITVIFVGLLIINGLVLWAIFPTNRVIASWKQLPPSDQQQTQYEMQLIEEDRRIFYGPFERAMELHVHRAGNPGYGHSVPIRLFGKANDQECSDSCFVNWTESGIEFTQSSGHRLFIPKSAYIGGR